MEEMGEHQACKAKMFPLFRLISCHSEFLSVNLQRYKISLFRKDIVV